MSAQTAHDALIVVGAGVLMATPYLSPYLSPRLRGWLCEADRQVDAGIRVLDQQPLPEPPPVEPEPDEHEESRPVDIDDCPRCEGQGVFIDVRDGSPAWATCGWCAGTGRWAR